MYPFGADVLTHGSGEVNRSFDVISYGRIPRQYDRVLAETFNQPSSERIYYRSTARREEIFPKTPYEERTRSTNATMPKAWLGMIGDFALRACSRI
jgi:hypothetical protein